MRYVVVAGLFLLALLGAQTAGAQSAEDTFQCSGVVVVPADKVQGLADEVGQSCTQHTYVVATINDGWQARDLWVDRAITFRGRIRITLNTAKHDAPVKVAWIGFQAP